MATTKKKKSAEQIFAEEHGLTMQQWQAIDDRFTSTPGGITILKEAPGLAELKKKKTTKKTTTKTKKK